MMSSIKGLIYNSIIYQEFDKLKTWRFRKDLKAKGFQSICEFNWRPLKKSDTLFILGSGNSIMDYSEEQWEEISKHDSFGLNGSVFHDFIPTYYAFEPMQSNEDFEFYAEAMIAKGEQYRNTPVFVQYRHMVKSNRLFYRKGMTLESIFYNAPYMPNTTNRKVLNQLLNRWKAKTHKTFNDLLHYSGTISYLMEMGYLMGYKKIVLLGVDLNNDTYFYEHPNANKMPYAVKFRDYKHRQQPPKPDQVSKEHKTLSKSQTAKYGCLPISDFISDFNEVIAPDGVQVFIGSKKSALYPMLNYFSF